MTIHRVITAASAAALLSGLIASSALAQTPAPAARTATTQAQAAQATGRPTTDAPAATQRQGAAAAVAQGTGAAPATPPAPSAAAGAFRPIAPAGDIVATLQASGEFKTFIKGLDATNLTPVLKSNPHLTVFAPTDAAFAAYGNLDQLFAPANATALQKLLLHHIINAEIDSSKYKNAYGPIPTGAGDKVVIDGRNEPMKADQANILQTDVHATNGVIDVVDQVLKAGSVPETLPQDQAQPPAEEKPAPAAEPEKKAPAKHSGTKRRR